MKKLLYRDRWEIVLLIVVSALLILLGLRTTAANSRSLADTMSFYQKPLAGYDSQIKNAIDADTRAALIENKSGTEEMLVDMAHWFQESYIAGPGETAERVIVLLFVMQFVKWLLFEKRNGVEFAVTLPISRRRAFMHEAVLGTVLLVGSAIVYLAGLLTVYQTLLNKCGMIITDSNVLAGVKDFSKVPVSYLFAPFVFALLLYSILLCMRAVSNSPGACMFLCGLGWLLFHYADFGKATAAIEDFKQKYNLMLNGIMYAPDTRELPDAFHMLPVLLILLLFCLLFFRIGACLEKRKNLSKGGAFQSEWLTGAIVIVSMLLLFRFAQASASVLLDYTGHGFYIPFCILSVVLAFASGAGLFYILREK